MFPEMELSCSDIRKNLTFSQKQAFFIFPKMEPYTFQPKLEKNYIYISGNGDPKNFLCFRK